MQKKKNKQEIASNSFGATIGNAFITHIDGTIDEGLPGVDEHTKYPVLTIVENIPMPELPQPLKLDNEHAIEVANYAFENNLPLFVTNPVDPGKLIPDSENDILRLGILAKIAKVIKLPDNQTLAFISTFDRAFINDFYQMKPYASVSVFPLPGVITKFPKNKRQNLELLVQNLIENYSKINSYLSEEERDSLNISLDEPGPVILKKLYGVTLSVPLTIDEKRMLLDAKTLEDLLLSLVKSTDLVLQRLSLQASINMKTHETLSSQQKEMFLRQQMKSIQEELGVGNEQSDFDELRAKASEKKWSKRAREHFNKELKKLERLFPQSPDYSIQYAYLTTLLALPWDNYKTDNFSISKVEKILDRDHYGLEQVKERIKEQMAVIKLRNDLKSPIICFVGPPGVGKTSLGKSIAQAMGRDYARISLGGIHDEAEIRGHRRTYIGAMPGRIIASLEKCGSGNPVFVLDEIDKIRKDFKGDPSAALLEVLDPEQNAAFHDNFVDFDYDLSKILFIATANDPSEISAPLLDRMEIIEINGYTVEEKIEIAKRHLVAKKLADNGFEKNEITFDKGAIAFIINHYTRESGVRQLEKKISKVLRKIALKKASGQPFPTTINKKLARQILGIEEMIPESYSGNDYAGVVTGLAWTSSGGDILLIETSLSPGKGDKQTVTGNLGKIMQESTAIAYEYIKAHAAQIGIKPDLFEKYNLHIHVPEGAVPKDGPSAGITIATSIASAFTGRKVRDKIAMTGELTLRGKVLPVGGIKEKILAAKRAGITDIILSRQNRRNIEDINNKYISGMNFHYVDDVNEVLDLALLTERAAKPVIPAESHSN